MGKDIRGEIMVKELSPKAKKHLRELAELQDEDVKFSIGISRKEYKLPYKKRKNRRLRNKK